MSDVEALTELKDAESWVFSPTQLKTWTLCQRKWAWSSLHKIRESNKYAQRGTECHLRIENWLLRGVVPGTDRYGTIVRPGLKHLPPPFTAAGVERAFVYVSPNGFRYRGLIDVDYFDEKMGRPVVFDHKTTTDFKWALSVDDLRNDTQALIYAAESLTFHKAELVDLRWIYYRDTPSSPAARVVATTLHKDEVKDKFDAIDTTAEDIRERGLKVKHALDLAPNPLACSQYGGCPHRERCKLSDGERLEAIMEQTSIREKLMGTNGVHKNEATPAPAATSTEKLSARERLLGAVPQTAPAAATPAPATSTAAPGSARSKLLASPTSGAQPPAQSSARTKLLGSSTPVAVPASSVPPTEASVQRAVDVMAEIHQAVTEVAPGQINPPEQPAQPLESAQEVQALVQAKKDAEKAEKDARKPGRPKGSVNFRPVTDEGHIFAAVFCEALRAGLAHDTAGDLAKAAVASFQTIAK